MTTKSTELQDDLKARVKEIEAELAELERRRREASDTCLHADKRLDELDERRTAISTKVFLKDEEAILELEALEDEHDRLARSARVARSAVPQFDGLIAEAKDRLCEAQGEVHKHRHEALRDEYEALEPSLDEAVKEVVELLDQKNGLLGQMLRELGAYDQDQANRMASGNVGWQKRWIEDKFRRWLR